MQQKWGTSFTNSNLEKRFIKKTKNIVKSQKNTKRKNKEN